MKSNKHVKTYTILGSILCGLAGGIIGFFVGGALLAIPGVLIGVLAGYLMKKSVLTHSL